MSALAPSRQILSGWERLVVNRPRPYAVQQADGSYRWVYERCDRSVLLAHLAGELTVAMSCLDGSGFCRWICLDADAADGLASLVQLRDQMELLGFSGMVEASRRGGHLWLCFTESVPAGLARRAVQGALDRLRSQGIILPRLELYPDAEAGLGHAVRLPLGIHRRTGKRYPLLDSAGQALTFTSQEGALAWILARPRIAPSWLRASWSAFAPVDPTRRPARSSTRSSVIRWVDDQVNPLDLLDEMAPESSMRKVGKGYLGWCPFHPDASPQADGSLGTPSFYVVHHPMHGWEWRCLSTNCPFEGFPMHHSFRLFCELQGLDVRAGIVAARQHWPELATSLKGVHYA